MATTLLQTSIDRLRKVAVEPGVNSEWTDTEILDNLLAPAFVTTYEDLALSQTNPVQIGFSITLATDQRYYTLPPHVQRVVRVLRFSTATGASNTIIDDWVPRSQYNPVGPGWRLNGAELDVFPVPTASTNGQVWVFVYVPSAAPTPHTGLIDTNPTTTTLTLSATPALGALDRAANAYGGCTLRITDPSLATVHERVISSYDPDTLTVTLFNALPSATFASKEYEITPPLGPPLYETAIRQAVLDLKAIHSAPQRDYLTARDRLLASRKALRNSFANREGRVGRHFAQDTIDSREYLTVFFPFTY